MTKRRTTTEYDVVVIGAGPAGLMAGHAAASRGLRVLIAEKMERACRKLRISGKGRCNLCNNCDTETFMRNIRRGDRFLYSSFSAMDSAAVMAFFESRGLPLKTERGARVYPQSDSAHDVAETLIGAAKTAGCVLERLTVTGLALSDGEVRGVETREGGHVPCRAVILATGGLSYPRTGSTGDGYRLAGHAGHKIVPPRASLVPLECAGGVGARLQGLSLRNVALTTKHRDRVIFSQQGELLFTHFGISGPLTLSLSAHLVGVGFSEVAAELDLKPALDDAALDRRILRDFGENSNRDFKNSLGALLPAKMIDEIVSRSGIAPDKKVHSITSAERARLVAQLKRFRIELSGHRPIEEAVVTAGGIALDEVNPKTMMSKLVKNLHFAGEVLDADGLTGGFNLGIAFATGHAAGSHVLEEE